MTNVIVGTNNPSKRDAVLKVFNIYFDDVNIEMLNVDSDVPKQPMNSKEIVRGARNRINNIKKVLGKKLDKYEFLVAVEAGIIVLSRNYYNIQYVIIENVKTGKITSGFSQGIEIPTKYIEIARQSSINKVFNLVFNKNGESAMSMLTKGKFTRKDIIENGVLAALIGQIHDEKW